MFEFLSIHNVIVVTGPQRSGTGICTQMIAHDLGYEYVREETTGDRLITPLDIIRGCLTAGKKAVFHQAKFSPWCHLLPDDIAIVFMLRDLEEIKASQERIQWPMERWELDKVFREEGPIADVKYEIWSRWQKREIKHAYEVPYESLKDHPLWKAPEDRTYTVLK